MRKLLVSVALTFAFSAAPAAFADVYQYSLSVHISYPAPYWNEQVIFDLPTLITSETTVTPSEFLSCTSLSGTCGADLDFLYQQTLVPSGYGSIQPDQGIVVGAPLSVIEGGGSSSAFDVDLTVTDISQAPEPSSLFLLGSGAVSMLAVVRRRFI